MSNIWFLGDSHFGHKNICLGESDWADKSSCRPFNTIQEHDDYIINEINKYVKSTDILYHLGDFGLGFNLKEKLKEIRNRIKCEQIHIILGNHDHLIENAQRNIKRHHEQIEKGRIDIECDFEYKQKLIQSREIINLFKSINYLKFGKIGGHPICLCHYAMKIWPWSHQGSYHLYGHSHNNLKDDENSLSMDIGLDVDKFGHKKFTPFSFDEIDHIMKTQKKFAPIDHHK